MSFFRIDPGVIEVFKMGLFYLCGRDKANRPVYVVKPNKIKKSKIKNELFIRSFIIYSQMIRQYCFREYKIENWIMLMDLEKKSVFDFSFKSLSLILKSTDLFLGACMHKLFMLNPSSFFSFSFKVIEKMLDKSTRQKIYMLKPKDYPKMFEFIAPTEITEEYGGSKRDGGVYWPPVLMKKDNEIGGIDVSRNVFCDSRASYMCRSLGRQSEIRESKGENEGVVKSKRVVRGVRGLKVGDTSIHNAKMERVGLTGDEIETVIDFNVFLEENNGVQSAPSGPRFILTPNQAKPAPLRTSSGRLMLPSHFTKPEGNYKSKRDKHGSNMTRTRDSSSFMSGIGDRKVLNSVLIEDQSIISFRRSYMRSVSSLGDGKKGKTGSTAELEGGSEIGGNRIMSVVPFWKQ